MPQGKLNVWQTFISILIALVIGGLIQFLLARGPGRGFLYRFGRYIGLTSPRFDAASARVKKGGALSISIAILVPGVRGAAVVASGVANMPLRIFLPGLVVGSVLFLGLHFFLGFLGGSLLYYRTCATITSDSFACISVVVNYICGLGCSSKTSEDSAIRCGGDFTRTMA